jgi:hypothetical protein
MCYVLNDWNPSLPDSDHTPSPLCSSFLHILPPLPSIPPPHSPPLSSSFLHIYQIPIVSIAMTPSPLSSSFLHIHRHCLLPSSTSTRSTSSPPLRYPRLSSSSLNIHQIPIVSTATVPSPPPPRCPRLQTSNCVRPQPLSTKH